jgi:hypothetical protein
MPTFIGLDHDFTVKLNDQDIIAQRTFAVTKVRSSGLLFLALLQI